MGQVVHGCATTAGAIRRAMQRSEASVRALARRHGIRATTVQGWRKRDTAGNARMGPGQISSSVLTIEQDATVTAVRRHTLPPLHDCLHAGQATIPGLTRPSLHRCRQSPACPIRQLPPPASGSRPPRSASSPSTSNQGLAGHRRGPHRAGQAARARRHQSHQHVRRCAAARQGHAPDRCRPPARRRRSGAVQGPRRADRQRRAVPPQPAKPQHARGGSRHRRTLGRAASRAPTLVHAFDRACTRRGIEHRTTKPHHPGTNGQVEQMNRTIKQATVRRDHCGTHNKRRAHLKLLADACTYGQHLRAIGRHLKAIGRPHGKPSRPPKLDQTARALQRRPVKPPPRN